MVSCIYFTILPIYLCTLRSEGNKIYYYYYNKSYCMVIDNKSQNMKYTHPVTLNNNVLPYTTKCKYLGHIINNNLTDEDDIARQKIYFDAHANVLARKFRFLQLRY